MGTIDGEVYVQMDVPAQAYPLSSTSCLREEGKVQAYHHWGSQVLQGFT